MSEIDGLKSIQDIISLGKNFLVEDYQRGYRWTDTEVTQLLEDINEFDGKGFYCLQPVVVKNILNDKKEIVNIELIDGQQRMTTIFFILKYLNENLFDIKYVTRENSTDFLTEIKYKNEKESADNIDFFHFFKAYQTIKNWFNNKDENECNAFKNKLLNHCKVIWYEVPAGTDKTESIKIFTRINSGKIPLTNAELIKALFLINVSNKKEAKNEILQLKQNEIAQQWDQIEYALQDDRFWYFVSNDTPPATRIEFIFDLIQNKPKVNQDKLFTFLEYNTSFKIATDKEKWVEDEWKKVRDTFQTLQEWYEDRELYHLVGYLVEVISDLIIKKILEEKQNSKKSEFKSFLKNKISSIICGENITPIEDLVYGKDNVQLVKVLLLHNIITTLKSDDTSLRFPFNKYKNKKNGGWSLEHIHAQNSEDIRKLDDFKEWFNAIDENELTEEIRQKIHTLSEKDNQDEISQIVEDISKLFGEVEIHSIENMALLSKNDNSKLNNGLFPVKRERIIELEKNGAFIPLTTKKVFQKYFKGCTKQLSKWEEKDRTAYLNDITSTLQNYLDPTTKD